MVVQVLKMCFSRGPILNTYQNFVFLDHGSRAMPPRVVCSSLTPAVTALMTAKSLRRARLSRPTPVSPDSTFSAFTTYHVNILFTASKPAQTSPSAPHLPKPYFRFPQPSTALFRRHFRKGATRSMLQSTFSSFPPRSGFGKRDKNPSYAPGTSKKQSTDPNPKHRRMPIFRYGNRASQFGSSKLFVNGNPTP